MTILTARDSASHNTKTDEAKDSPLFINLVWKLKILHPLLSLITKFVCLFFPCIRASSPFRWAAYTFVSHSIYSEIQLDEKFAEFCSHLANYMYNNRHKSHIRPSCCQVKYSVFQRLEQASAPTNAAIGSRVPPLDQYRHVP